METMSDETTRTPKLFPPNEIFQKELYRMHNYQRKRRLDWIKCKVGEVLGFIEERQLKWSREKINEVLVDIVDNQMPTDLKDHLLYLFDNKPNPSKFNSDDNIKPIIVPENNYYEVLIDVHLATDHGNFHEMVAYMKKKKYLISKLPLDTFLTFCQHCNNNNLQKDTSLNKSNLPLKPAVINFIDLRAKPAGMCNWILYYYDFNTNCSLLLPMISNHPTQVAYKIQRNIKQSGWPTSLYGDGSDFITEVYNIMINNWPLCKNVQLRHCHQIVMDKMSENIMKLIQDWLVENDCINWSFGVNYLQCKIDCIFDGIRIKVTPEGLIWERIVTLKKVSTDPVDERNKDAAKSHNETKDLKDDVNTNIIDNYQHNKLTNALGDLNIALNE